MKVGRLPGNYFFFNLDFRKMSAVRKSKEGGGGLMLVRFFMSVLHSRHITYVIFHSSICN